MTTTTRFKLFDVKKHSVRYNADPVGEVEPNMISVYVSKTALTTPYPKFIAITVEELPAS